MSFLTSSGYQLSFYYDSLNILSDNNNQCTMAKMFFILPLIILLAMACSYLSERHGSSSQPETNTLNSMTAESYAQAQCALQAQRSTPALPSENELISGLARYNPTLVGCYYFAIGTPKEHNPEARALRFVRRIWNIDQNRLVLECDELNSGKLLCGPEAPTQGRSRNWLQTQLDSYMGPMGN